jgi:hypothetical protein
MVKLFVVQRNGTISLKAAVHAGTVMWTGPREKKKKYKEN